MSKKSNPTLIGAFVVGAVLLLAAGVALFGGSELLARKNIYVAYFEDRVKGLRVGANVLLQGVRVGYVSDIDLLADVNTLATISRVTIEILPETVVVTRDGRPVAAEMSSLISHRQLLEAGLRAQLAVESFVTGQLLVELEFRPDTPAVMRGADPPYPEIPTVSSNIQELLNKVQTWVADIQESVDFAELGERLHSVLRGMDDLVNSADVRESLAGANRLINSDAAQQLATSLQQTMRELRAASADAGRLFRNADDDLDALVADLKPVARRLSSALQDAERTLAAAERQLAGDTEQVYRLQSALEEVEDAARAVRDFFDYVERNPEALLRGKQR